MDKTNENRKKEAAESKKDYYVPVMLCQIVLCVCAVVLLLLFVNGDSSGKLKGEISEIMQSEIDYGEISEAVQSAASYFNFGKSWAVFGSRVSYKTETDATNETEDETETTELNETTALAETTDVSETAGSLEATGSVESTGVFEATQASVISMGGVDLKTYEAKKNTSFAPYKVTALILSPIKNGRYTSYFGYRTNPITGEFSFHTGLDIAAEKGTAIRAAWNGTVIKTGEDSQAGKYIFLEHDDGFVTFYCHCSEITAQKGAVIRQGETIARVGSTGWSTGPHLHFEIRKDNIRMNPLWALENDC